MKMARTTCRSSDCSNRAKNECRTCGAEYCNNCLEDMRRDWTGNDCECPNCGELDVALGTY